MNADLQSKEGELSKVQSEWRAAIVAESEAGYVVMRLRLRKTALQAEIAQMKRIAIVAEELAWEKLRKDGEAARIAEAERAKAFREWKATPEGRAELRTQYKKRLLEKGIPEEDWDKLLPTELRE